MRKAWDGPYETVTRLRNESIELGNYRMGENRMSTSTDWPHKGDNGPPTQQEVRACKLQSEPLEIQHVVSKQYDQPE